MAEDFDISREQMDLYAIRSHQRLAQAMEAGHLQEITPLYDSSGKTYEADDGVRPDSTQEKLAKLKPVFDRPIGKVTASVSSAS
ncbi:hypothetical protein [Thiolapillus sp.]|uniref:thiolase family protein n=1 Tax=Thiolapillus sp. TaxID=2017437 RepID=UPI003AF9BCF2